MSKRLQKLREATRPIRRTIEKVLFTEFTARVWVAIATVIATVVLTLLLTGCQTTEAPDLSTREGLKREAQRLSAEYGPRDNWPAAEKARWEEAAHALGA